MPSGFILTDAQQEYLEDPEGFIDEGEYDENYRHVMNTRCREKFNDTIEDLDFLLHHSDTWMKLAVDPMKLRESRLADLMERLRSHVTHKFIYDVVRKLKIPNEGAGMQTFENKENHKDRLPAIGGTIDIDAYGLMLQADMPGPPLVDRSSGPSMVVPELRENLQSKLDLSVSEDPESKSLGIVGSLVNELLPMVSVDWDEIKARSDPQPEGKALSIVLLTNSGDPIEEFTLAVDDKPSIVLVDSADEEWDRKGHLVAYQETALRILDPEDEMTPQRARYQYANIKVFPKNDSSRELIWIIAQKICENLIIN